jgi:hypothetical protein
MPKKGTLVGIRDLQGELVQVESKDLKARIAELERRLAAIPPPAPTPTPLPVPVPVPVTTSVDATALRIVAWLRDTHTADTVRAQYARKLADKIEAGEHTGAVEEHAA